MSARVKPIPFSAPMIKALLSGAKSQTRRVLKLPKKTFSGGVIYERKDMGGWEPTTIGGAGVFTIGKHGERVPEPEMVAIWHRTCGVCVATPYQPGDLLWVREAWRVPQHFDDRAPSELPNGEIVPRLYVADGERKFWRDADPDGRLRAGMHMPRWASRLTLRVTEVRVERVQEISEADAVAEGIFRFGTDPALYGYDPDGTPGPAIGATAIEAFAHLWEKINFDRGFGWEVNPWVAVVRFDCIKENVDSVLRGEAA